MADKQFDWRKFLFTRLPTSGEWWGKLMDLAWKLLILWLVYTFLIVPIFTRFFQKTPQIATISGGTVDLSQNKKSKSGINFLNFGGA